jgi:hypothetical protein
MFNSAAFPVLPSSCFSTMCEVNLMNESHETLTAFDRCARNLIELLYQDQHFNMAEQMLIDQHLVLLRSALEAWKRRNAS